MTTPGQIAWQHAGLAFRLLCIDPVGLGGIVLRARSGPVRDAYLEGVGQFDGGTLRLHPSMTHEALFGGMDLAATLSSGGIVTTPGMLSQDGLKLLTMAERCSSDRAAEFARWLDETGGPLIAMDEGAEPGETAPPALSERLAFHLNLDSVGRLEARPWPRWDASAARARLADVASPKTLINLIVGLAVRLGIDSIRAPLQALSAARAHAALEGRDEITEADVEVAASLVLAPRAIVLPTPPEPEAPEPEDSQPSQAQKETQIAPEDILVDAIQPYLPSDLLAGITGCKSRGAEGAGAGGKRKSNRRGRPLPSRPGRLGSGARVDLVATLRTAAPWQGLRKRGNGPVKVLPSDIRLKRYEEKSDRLVIFAVDASGSAAMARLAEAKGAVEVLLGQAYASRDHVALVAFRGEEADLLLPPTRSLVQTKRRLAALPGGGGTPLATGLRMSGELALRSQAQGLSPTVALLTDGRANIALDGQANRKAAGEDASQMARWLRAEGIPSVVFDTGMRPEAALQRLVRELGARYLPLPRADARALGQALSHELGA